MSRSRGVAARIISLSLTGLIVALAGGCNSSPQSDDGSALAVSPAVLDSPKLTGYPPDADTAALRKFVQALDFKFEYPKDTNRIAIVHHTCGGACNVTFLAVPEKHARKVDWAGVFGNQTKPGHVVAVYQMTDEIDLPELGLKAGGRAYHWVGQIDRQGTPGTALLVVDETNWTATLWAPSPNASFCTLSEDPDKPSQVRRNKKHHPVGTVCEPIKNPSRSASTGIPAGKSLLIPATTWISCKNGCCESLPQ